MKKKFEINKFNIISGTSIGAINGYFIFTNNVEKLEEMWIDIDANIEHTVKIVDNTVDNPPSRLYPLYKPSLKSFIN